jgi:hypothetical protein
MKKIILFISTLLILSSCAINNREEKKEIERKPELSNPTETPFSKGPSGLLPPTS